MGKKRNWAAVLGGIGLLLPVLLHAQPHLQIMTSIKPLQLMAVAVAGDAANVEVLLSSNISPHDYQFRPSDQDKLRKADVVFWVGPQLEIFLQNALASLPDRVRVVSLQKKADVEDAHIWMDPLRAIAIVRQMAVILGELAPAQRQQWHDNAERTVTALQREDESLRSQLAGLQSPRRYLVVHDAYRQFETRYGLKHEATLTNTSDQAPGARNMAHIQELLSNGSIQCVLREPLHQPKALQNLLRGNSVRVITVDALAGDIALRQDGIVEFYRRFGQAMLACLKS